MPTLLQINICLNLSTGKIAQAIGEHVISHGWNSYIAYSCRCATVPSKSNVIKVGNFADPYFHYLENRIFDREGLGSRRSTRKLIEMIKEISPDVIQLHNIHDHYLNYRILFEFLNTTEIKVVWTFHDCWAFTGHCMHFVTKGCKRWVEGCYNCPMKGEYPRSILDRSSENWRLKKSLFGDCKNLAIVACSDWMAGFVRESFLKEKPISVIKNGVDIDTFTPHPRRQDEKYKVLTVSGVWHKAKGEYDIYHLRKLLPKNKFDIIMVGLTSRQINNLPEGIHGIERTQNINELVKLYCDADVLINPTYADTFPTVNLESLACGTPVITYDTGGSPEAVDEKTGIVVKQGDVESLANAIIKLKLNSLSSSDCRIRAVEYYDKNKCFEKYVDLYNKLLSI